MYMNTRWRRLLIRLSPRWGSPRFSSAIRRSVHSPRDHFIITLFISDRRDWCDIRGKWPLARQLDRSWWHRHTSIKLFWPLSMSSWTTGNVAVSEESRSGGEGGKIEWKLSEVNTRAVSRGQDELIGEFKIATSDVINSCCNVRLLHDQPLNTNRTRDL